jgi:hypothetical protein
VRDYNNYEGVFGHLRHSRYGNGRTRGRVEILTINRAICSHLGQRAGCGREMSMKSENVPCVDCVGVSRKERNSLPPEGNGIVSGQELSLSSTTSTSQSDQRGKSPTYRDRVKGKSGSSSATTSNSGSSHINGTVGVHGDKDRSNAKSETKIHWI